MVPRHYSRHATAPWDYEGSRAHISFEAIGSPRSGMASKAWYKPSVLPQLIARFDPPASASEHARKRSIEVWTTTCIVTNFGMRRDDENDDGSSHPHPHPRCSTLINPANPNLSGPNSFPYFPRGGPQPPTQPNRHAHHIMGYVSQWGGMDVGSGMLFSAEAVDGLVHQLGGLRLHAECALVPAHEHARAYVNQQATEPEAKDDATTCTLRVEDARAKCPVGTAVATSPGGEALRKHYDRIIHTTPPFCEHPPWMSEILKKTLGIIDEDVSGMHSWSRELLRSCYRQSFRLAFETDNIQSGEKSSFLSNPLGLLVFGKPPTRQSWKRAAVPLLGAGCRAFPKDLALEVAALEGSTWLSKFDSERRRGTTKRDRTASVDEDGMSVVFGLLERTDAEALSEKLERRLMH